MEPKGYKYALASKSDDYLPVVQQEDEQPIKMCCKNRGRSLIPLIMKFQRGESVRPLIGVSLRHVDKAPRGIALVKTRISTSRTAREFSHGNS